MNGVLQDFVKQRILDFPLWWFFALTSLACAAGYLSDLPDGGPSAFFVDNKTRRTLPSTATDSLRYWLKIAFLLVCVTIQYMVMFGAVAERKKKNDERQVSVTREWLCLLCGVIFISRILIQMRYWTRVVTWVEVFAEAGGVIPISLVSLALGVARRRGAPIGIIELIGLVLFVFGTSLNMEPEFTRNAWKSDVANKGRLYTGGLFALCRHINYFGEVVSFVGFALVSSAWWNLWIPIVMGAGLVFVSVPELDTYLAAKYPSEWPQYVEAVSCQMVPFVW